MKLVLVSAVLAFSSTVLADQCTYVTEAQAKKALKIILETESVQSLCEPCGETKAQSIDVRALSASDVNYKGFWKVELNGQTVDLAYTYVNGFNLATLVSCPVKGVSPSLNN